MLDPCASQPCSHGTCTISASTWMCVCEPGWTGIECKDSINECLSNPCLNAGVCIDDVNSYHCICLTGYTGTYCQTPINPCSSFPCENNGRKIHNNHKITNIHYICYIFRYMCKSYNIFVMYMSRWLDRNIL